MPDLYDLAHLFGWALYNLHDLGPCFLGQTCTIHRPCTKSQNGGLGFTLSRSLSICPSCEIFPCPLLTRVKSEQDSNTSQDEFFRDDFLRNNSLKVGTRNEKGGFGKISSRCFHIHSARRFTLSLHWRPDQLGTSSGGVCTLRVVRGCPVVDCTTCVYGRRLNLSPNAAPLTLLLLSPPTYCAPWHIFNAGNNPYPKRLWKRSPAQYGAYAFAYAVCITQRGWHYCRQQQRSKHRAATVTTTTKDKPKNEIKSEIKN